MKLDRLLGILTVLLQNDRVTAPQLAERFEVARRTIGRDIDALCRAGIPVVTGQGAGGGIWIQQGYKLDKRVLTRDELSGLIVALKGLGTVSDGSQIERTLLKLGAGSDAVMSLDAPIVINLASHYQGSLTGKIEQIKRAILERRLIAFDYFYDKGESRRRIEPLLIAFQWESWYAFGYCLERQDFRMFKLARLWNLETLDEPFTPREIPPARREFAFPDEHRVTALFDPSAKYQLMECYGPDCFEETPDGLLATIRYTNRGFIITWLLAFADKARVLDPPDLADEMRSIAQKMVDRYRET